MRLLENRSKRRPDRKHVHGSTPTVRHGSIVEDEYAQSKQGHLHVPCPHCNHMQMLVMGPRSQFAERTQGRIVGEIAKGYLKFDPYNATWAVYVCEQCGKEIDESEKATMVQKGCARLDGEYYYGYKFANVKAAMPGVVGFHFNELYSLLPGSSWVTIANQFLEAKRGGSEKLQPFINTVLAETFQATRTESITSETLRERQEQYFEGDNPLVPKDVLNIIATVDPQVDRIEMQLTGFGIGEEAWELALL